MQSSSTTSFAPAGLPAQIRSDASGCLQSVVYVAGRDSIKIYDQTHFQSHPCGTISGLTAPQGLMVDTKGNLWFADPFGQKVYKFAPGAHAPALALSDPNGVPAAVAIDDASGTVYVTEYQNNVDASTLVEVYANGSTTPTGTLGDPDARNGGFGALDDHGNLYVSFMTQSNKAQVDRWIGGSGSPENLGLKLISAGSIVTTSSGALAMCDPADFRCGIFEPGSTKMSHVFGHMGFGRHGGVKPNKAPWIIPEALALDYTEHRAYVAGGSVTKWAFPGPGNRPNHLPLVEIKLPGRDNPAGGIAVSPASRPGIPYH